MSQPWDYLSRSREGRGLIVAGKNEAQKRKFVSSMIEGTFGAIAVTEEKAGSDVMQIRERHVDGDIIRDGRDQAVDFGVRVICNRNGRT